MMKQIFFGLIGAFVINTSYAVTLTINEGGDTIGQNKKVTLKKGESLSMVARRYGVALREVVAVNPQIAKGKRLPPGTQVTVPIQYRLPSGPRSGIVLNLAELRIFYFHPDGTTVSTYPVAVGKQGWSTPQGITTVVSKEKNPAWRPPKSIRREAARGGRSLPLVIPPGPHNPLGRYAMRLGISGILIHGTNKPQSIGTRSSHGCIRMYSKDIEELFNFVAVGTDVHIIHETKAQTAAKIAARVNKPSLEAQANPVPFEQNVNNNTAVFTQEQNVTREQASNNDPQLNQSTNLTNEQKTQPQNLTNEQNRTQGQITSKEEDAKS